MLTSRFGLVAVGLLVSVPLLLPVHSLPPVPTFHTEWLAACLGLAAGVALLGARRLPLPGAALLVLALAGLAFAQLVLARAPLPQLTMLFALYMVWAALLACAGAEFARTVGQARLVRWLAVGLLLASVLASLASLLQPWVVAAGWPVFPPSAGGTLAQANHLTSYLWLGLASALYLRARAALSARVFWPVAAVLALTAVLVGQRSSFLYALALIGVAAWQAKADGQRATLRQAVAIGLLFVALQPVALLLPPSFYADGGVPSPALRAIQQVEGPSLRMQLLRVGAAGIMAAPLLGNGVGSYPGLSLAHADELAPANNPGPSEHAHNLFVHLGAELGLPAAMLVALGAFVWLRRLPQRAEPPEAAWAGAVFVILGAHSMIEYPLWHTFFLGPLAIVAGAFGSTRAWGTRLAPAALSVGLLAWGGLTLADLRHDYVRIESAIALGKQPETVAQAKASLLGVTPASLLAPLVSIAACDSLDPFRVAVADGLAVCEAAMTCAPRVEHGARLAVLLRRAGKSAEAEDLMRRLRRNGQYDEKKAEAALAPLIVRDPGLRGLLLPRE